VTITVGTKPYRRSSYLSSRTAADLSGWGCTKISRTSPSQRTGLRTPSAGRRLECRNVEFATKPKIGIAMVAAALNAGVPCAWVLGDAVYGSDKTLRVVLERHDKPYVLSIRGNERLMMGDFRTHSAEELAADLSAAKPK
jgi:SRSO17 transposase